MAHLLTAILLVEDERIKDQEDEEDKDEQPRGWTEDNRRENKMASQSGPDKMGHPVRQIKWRLEGESPTRWQGNNACT